MQLKIAEGLKQDQMIRMHVTALLSSYRLSCNGALL